jgi:hypothetical protein
MLVLAGTMFAWWLWLRLRLRLRLRRGGRLRCGVAGKVRIGTQVGSLEVNGWGMEGSVIGRRTLVRVILMLLV